MSMLLNDCHTTIFRKAEYLNSRLVKALRSRASGEEQAAGEGLMLLARADPLRSMYRRVVDPRGSCRSLAKCRSFSAVSAPIFAIKYAFFSIFQNLQDYLAEFCEINFGKCLQILQHLQNVC